MNNAGKNTFKIAVNLFLLGTFLLCYWPPVTHSYFVIPFRFELIFLFATVIFFFNFIRSWRHNTFRFTREEVRILSILIIFTLSIILPTIGYYFKYDLTFNFIGMTLLIKCALGMGIFYAVYHIASQNISFYKAISWAFILPTLLFFPFVLTPDLAHHLGMVSDGDRFQGLTSNPVAFDLLAIIAFSFLASFFVYAFYKKENKLRLFFFLICLEMISALIFWTQTRSYLIAENILVISLFMLYGGYFKIKIGKRLLHAFMVVVFLACSFFILPKKVQNLLIFHRVLGIEEAQVQSKQAMSAQTGFSDKIYPEMKADKITSLMRDESKDLKSVLKDYYGNDARIAMWRNYYPTLVRMHPFGMGVNYYPTFAFHWVDGDKHKNTYLPPFFLFNVWALGGIVAVFCMCYFLFMSFVKFKKLLINSDQPFLLPYQIGVHIAFFTFWAMAIFNGLSIDYMGFWLILALALA